jgi:molybdenum cofactor cytidylyltransferase
MGQPKQLMAWKGKTLLEHGISEALKITKNVAVVLGAHSKTIKPVVDDIKVHIIENRNWQQGMGTSIAKGIEFLEEANKFEAVLIMLADQPLLGKSHLSTLINKFLHTKSPIVCTNYGDKLGVPAIFNRSLFGDLKKLNQDFGARQLIKKMGDSVFSVQPRGKVIDIDTLVTYKTLYEKYGR